MAMAPALRYAAPVVIVLVLTACASTPGPSASAPSPSVAAASPTAASTSPTPAASPSPSPSPAASPTPHASPSPVASPSASAAGSVGLTGCPAYDAGQHQLGPVGPPGAGVHADPTLNWSGCGNVTVPTGTSRFITGDNWQIGFAATCPNGLNYGAGGMGPNVTFRELLIGGGAGPDSQGGAGPWTDSAGGIMAHGGNYQLKITSIDPRCRWHVAVYPS